MVCPSTIITTIKRLAFHRILRDNKSVKQARGSEPRVFFSENFAKDGGGNE